MPNAAPPNRCRIVLIAIASEAVGDLAERLKAAAGGGDIASVILSAGGTDTDRFQALCEAVTPTLQQTGVAVLVEGDSRVAGRVGADGIHVEGGIAEIEEAEKARGRLMVGANGGKTRHEALEVGERQPDYVFFGRFGYDRSEDAHHRNLLLGEWWSSLMQIPCVVLGGSSIESVEAVAATGAEFVALSSAVLGEGADSRAAIEQANSILDARAPRFAD